MCNMVDYLVFQVLHEARFDASQTPLETPSLFTAAAFSSRFLPSDRNITRLLLLVSCDMTSVERTFSCQTVKRLKAHSPLTFSWSIVNTKKACCLSDSLSRASDLSGQKDSRILSRSSSERLTFHSGSPIRRRSRSLLLGFSVGRCALLVFSSSFLFIS